MAVHNGSDYPAFVSNNGRRKIRPSENVSGENYVLVEKLTTWLKSEVRPGSGITQIGRVLTTVYNDKDQLSLRLIVERALRTDDHYLVVFTILFKLSSAKLIDRFCSADFRDSEFPVSLPTLQHRFKAMDLPKADEFTVAFKQIQWAFYALKFELHESSKYTNKTVVPICKKELLNSRGGVARVWQIAIQEEFVGLALKDEVIMDGFDNKTDGHGPVSR
jgi:hypothetical protein